MAIVYLGLGSNIGDRVALIHQATRELEKHGIHILKMSSLIETDPVGGPPQGKYLNAALECKTTLLPEMLLDTIKEIEHSMGRVKSVIDGPRNIDIDILMYDQVKIQLPNLIIPHPRMLTRSFVLIPLKEIAPHLPEVALI